MSDDRNQVRENSSRTFRLEEKLNTLIARLKELGVFPYDELSEWDDE